MDEECEFCGYRRPYTLADASEGKESYTVCLNCLFSLATYSLSPEQFLRAKARGGDTNRYYLHDDFYDRSGHSLQPHV